MPSSYAHFRFGREALPQMPRDVNRLLQRFRQLYNIGLQGPDFLFYYNPVMHTEIGDLGRHYHTQSGREFFGNALQILRMYPSEGAVAYLYGVLGHYCLDSTCHPFIKGTAAEGKIGHTELETEFDRFLLERDGKLPPHLHRMEPFLRTTRGECVTMAQFYPAITPRIVHRSVQNMIWVNRLVTMKHRRVVEKLMQLGGKNGQEMVMTQTPNENCCQLDSTLLEMYTQALNRYPSLAEQLSVSISKDGALGDDFAPSFG